MQRLTGENTCCDYLIGCKQWRMENGCSNCNLSAHLQRLWEYENILFAADGTERITFDRLAELVQADAEGRAVVLPCKVEPFDCQHCKHLSSSDKTNRLFCSYHSEGEHQYEVYRDDYCSDFERAEAEQAKGERK